MSAFPYPQRCASVPSLPGFLHVPRRSRPCIGAYVLEPARLARFNRALRELSHDAPCLALEQMAAAGNRVLSHHAGPDGTPPFVLAKLGALARLQAMVADEAWGADASALHKVEVLSSYREDTDDLIPDGLPVVGMLDDAVLVDVGLQLLRDEAADYEDFSHFRATAARKAGITEARCGLTRAHWLEAMQQARRQSGGFDHSLRDRRHAADPRASLFHAC